MSRVCNCKFKILSLIGLSGLIGTSLIACATNSNSIEIKATNDTLISGSNQYKQTTISVINSAKDSNINWNDSITDDLTAGKHWIDYLLIDQSSDNTHCLIGFKNDVGSFDNFNIYIKVTLSEKNQSNTLTINVKHGQLLADLFDKKEFYFANDGYPVEQFYPRNAFAFNSDIPSDIDISDLTPIDHTENSYTYVCNLPKYFDSVTFTATLREEDNNKFSLDKIIPPEFIDFSTLDFTDQAIPLSPSSQWNNNDWYDFRLDFEENFENLVKEEDRSDLDFDSYFQIIHWDHVQVDSIDTNNKTLTLKGDNQNYYTGDTLTFTGVEFDDEN